LYLPGVASKLDTVLSKSLEPLAESLAPSREDALWVLPESGRQPSELLEALERSVSKDKAANGLLGGRSFGGLYHSLDELNNAALFGLHCGVTRQLLDTNSLYPGLFKTSRWCEAEVVSMVVSLLGGDASGGTGGGLLTSGGSESILLAVKAHRDAALAGIGFSSGKDNDGKPPILSAALERDVCLTILAGVTCHPALEKAAELFGLRLIKLPVDPHTLQLTAATVAAALTPFTALVFASAPGFAHGVVDEIEGIAGACRAYRGSLVWGTEGDGVPLHVDNCLGGVLLSFLRFQQPQQLPAFDFSVPGVSSISCDLHKFAGVPKGASVVAFRSASRRRHAYFACTSFPGGLYATPTLAGSRGGVSAGLAWATLLYHGAQGYRRAAARVEKVYSDLKAGISGAGGGKALKLLGAAHACILAFAPSQQACFSHHALSARMMSRGWQLPVLQNPVGCHIPVTERLLDTGRRGKAVWEEWLEDLNACIGEAMENPTDAAFEGKGEAGLYGATLVLPPGKITDLLGGYLDILTLVR